MARVAAVLYSSLSLFIISLEICRSSVYPALNRKQKQRLLSCVLKCPIYRRHVEKSVL